MTKGYSDATAGDRRLRNGDVTFGRFSRRPWTTI